MLKQDYKKEMITLGVQGALIVGLFVFYVFHSPATESKLAAKPAPKPESKTVQAKKPPVASKPVVRKYHKPLRLAKHKVKPAAVQPVPQPVQVQFPAATKITIAVAAEPQLVKLDAYQNPLAADAKNWDCVKDATTGLVWEVKTHDKGLRDANNYYTWYSSRLAGQSGNGVKDGGKCRGGIDCDTRSYVNAINAKRVCGYSDWRLPTRKELLTLVRDHSAGEQQSTIDTRYFPSTPGDWYWTADTDLGDSDHAWYVLFYNGRTMKALKSQAKRVRLVRGGIEQRRSFKDVAEKKDSDSSKEIARQPFQPESQTTLKKEMLSQN